MDAPVPVNPAVPLDPVLPSYGTASLADVLPGVLAALGVPDQPDPLGLTIGALAGVRRVAVLLVDGLGWHQLPIAAPHAPTLADGWSGRLGQARPITCGLPSTTPTSLVSLGTGAAPGAHGLVGFTVRVPGTDRVLNHIVWSDDPDPASWQPVQTAFEVARAAGVAGTVLSRSAFAGSGLTESAYRGAEYRGADTADELAAGMLAALGGSRLVYGYHPDVDHAGHVSGVDSQPWRLAVSEADRLIATLIDGLPEDAALLLTADHGQLDVPADCRHDLDTDPRLRAGVAVVAGEPRLRHLHTVPGARDDVLAAWRGVLGDRAEVCAREEAVGRGWFGPVPAAHLPRLGDVVVACRDRFAVLATASEPASVSRLVGFHGSYTAVEMRVPLWVVGGAR